LSTLAIDTPANRSNERLSMFLTEIGSRKPIDNYFLTHPLLDHLMKNCVTKDGGRQDFTDADTFITTVPDTIRTVAYAYHNKGASLVVMGEEQRETAGADHKTFDIIESRRESIIETVLQQYSQDLFAASQVAKKINSLNVLVDSTGEVGGLNASTNAEWAATETASGSFASQGLKDMRSLWNTLFNNKSKINTIVTTQSIYEFYENEVDPDVRYSTPQGVGSRGFESLEFKKVPIIYDPYATSGVIYMFDTKFTYLAKDSGWNMDFEPFVTPSNQKVSVSKFANRCNLVTTNRRTTGKLTGVVA
jgi:hypothetical protein